MAKKKKKTGDSADDVTKQLIEALVRGELTANGDGKNPLAVALGRLGGLKGGRARAASLSSEQRKVIARKAAQSRWNRGK